MGDMLPAQTTMATPAHHNFNNDMASKDMELVFNCASQIRDSLLDGRSTNTTARLPSVRELDTLIDRTGRMMRVLDDAKHRWYSPEQQPRTAKKKIPGVSPPQCHSCKSTETPEWRKGPMGPRTLCNACGLIWAKLSKKREHDDSDSEPRQRQRTRSTSPFSQGTFLLDRTSPTSPASSCSSSSSMASPPLATTISVAPSTTLSFHSRPPTVSSSATGGALALSSYPSSHPPTSAAGAVAALDRNKCAVSFLLS